MFAGHGPVNEDREAGGGIASSDIKTGFHQLASASRNAVPGWNTLLSHGRIASEGLVVWRVPVTKAVVPVVA